MLVPLSATVMYYQMQEVGTKVRQSLHKIDHMCYIQWCLSLFDVPDEFNKNLAALLVKIFVQRLPQWKHHAADNLGIETLRLVYVCFCWVLYYFYLA